MGVIGVVGMVLGAGEALTFGQLRTLPFAVVNNYAFAVLPMFVLMGVLAEAAGLTSQVFRAADLWLRRFRGGLYQAVIVGSAMFAAISGSTIVNAVVFTRIAFPEMMRFGYSKRPVHRIDRGGGKLRGDDSAVHHHGHLRDHDRAVGGAAPHRGSHSGTPDRCRVPRRGLRSGAAESFACAPRSRSR